MLPTEENIVKLQDKMWYVIKSEDLIPNNSTNNQNTQNIVNTNEIYDLKLNDIIKLGRVKFAITEIKNGDQFSVIDRDAKNSVFEAVFDCNSSKKTNNCSNEINCKICLANEVEDDNPMINLCKCSGSLLFVHFYCLKKWMSVKLSFKENSKKTVASYNMKSFNCEICKTPYPLRFKFGNNYFDLIESTRPTENYIVLESLNQVKDNNNYKSIHVITLKDNEKTIMGRGHDSDVRINDISVSRTHSCLVLNQGKIYLTDYKSKFGTLVLLQKPVDIDEKKLCLQIGRTLTELTAVGRKEKSEKVEKMSDFLKYDEKSGKGANSAGEKETDFSEFPKFHIDKTKTPSTNLNGLIDAEKFNDEQQLKVRKNY